MLDNYSNSENIKKSTAPMRAEYFSEKDLAAMSYSTISPPLVGDPSECVELHVYDISGNYIISQYKVGGELTIPPYASTTNTNRWFVDVDDTLINLGLASGQYKLSFNFFKQVLGSYDGGKLIVAEISPSRTEIRLKPQIVNLNGFGVDANADFSEKVFCGFDPTWGMIKELDLLVNFGGNDVLQAINYDIEYRINPDNPTGLPVPYSIIIKLYKPLPLKYEIRDACWLVVDLSIPYTDTVDLTVPLDLLRAGTLRGPNFDIDTDYTLNMGTDGYKAWNDLLGSGVSTSQQIVNTYFSGSLKGIKLNIDYCEFDNFVHFSSAEERVKNFKYKLGLIEEYDRNMSTVSGMTGATGSNLQVLTKKRNDIVAGFDDFENYLYFESGSGKYTFGSCSIHPWPKESSLVVPNPLSWQQASLQWNQANFTFNQGGATVSAAPVKPYSLYNTTSSIADAYYTSLVATASLYDRFNDAALNKSIPIHISEDPYNEQAIDFVNMIGHHYDILYTYVRHLNRVISRKEHPGEGMANELLYQVAESLGWKLTQGDLNSDLWNYTLGTNQAGSTQQTGSFSSKSGYDITREKWRRIVNNIPYFYKSKGTARSIKALMACYGIPQTMLSIKEYGGPKPTIYEKKPVFITEKYKYALQVNGNGQYIIAPWKPAKINSYRTPDTLEFRYLAKDGKSTSPSSMTLFQAGYGPRPEWYVAMNPTGSNKQKGNITLYLSGSAGYKSCSIQDEYLYDGNWAGLMVRRDTSTDTISTDNSYTLVVKKHKYGKITTDASASISIDGATESSYNNSWKFPDLAGSISLPKIHFGWGDNPTGDGHFSGSYQEIRYWTRPLDAEDFENHVTSPGSYDGSEITSSFGDLKFRIPLRERFDLALTSSMMSQHPNQNLTEFSESIITSASFVGFVSQSSFNGIDETYYIENPSLGGLNVWSEKVRVEDSTLSGSLSIEKSVEQSEYDTAPLDSNFLGVYFSPQNSINEDIYNQLGFFEIDDYLKDPDNPYDNQYPELRELSEYYWKKYSDKNDFNEYLQILYQYDESFFKQIRQLLPARVDLMDGVVIEPNVLERNVIAYEKGSTFENLTYSSSLGGLAEPTTSGEYRSYAGEIDTEKVYVISSSYSGNSGSIELKKSIVPTTYSVTSYYDNITGSFATSGSEVGSGTSWQYEYYAVTESYDGLHARVYLGAGANSKQLYTEFGGINPNGLPPSESIDIVGVKCTYHMSASKDNRIFDHSVMLASASGATFGASLALSESLYGATTRSYGGRTSLWGTDSENIKHAIYGSGNEFSSVLQFHQSGPGDHYGYVDGVLMEFYYRLKKQELPYWYSNVLQPCITGSKRESYIKKQSLGNGVNQKTIYENVYFDTGWHYPSESANYAIGGTPPWVNFQNITGSPDTKETFSEMRMNTTVGTGDYIYGWNYGFNLPSGSEVKGIQLKVGKKVEGSSAGSDGIWDRQIYFFTSSVGSQIGSNLANSVDWYESSTYLNNLTEVYYGNSNNTHSISPVVLTLDTINTSSFGVSLSLSSSLSGVVTASVDTLAIKIFYNLTGSLYNSDVQDTEYSGLLNSKFDGAKMTSADWNVDSDDTSDGGPVVSIFPSNPNQLQAAPYSTKGSIKIV